MCKSPEAGKRSETGAALWKTICSPACCHGGTTQWGLKHQNRSLCREKSRQRGTAKSCQAPAAGCNHTLIRKNSFRFRSHADRQKSDIKGKINPGTTSIRRSFDQSEANHWWPHKLKRIQRLRSKSIVHRRWVNYHSAYGTFLACLVYHWSNYTRWRFPRSSLPIPAVFTPPAPTMVTRRFSSMGWSKAAGWHLLAYSAVILSIPAGTIRSHRNRNKKITPFYRANLTNIRI